MRPVAVNAKSRWMGCIETVTGMMVSFINDQAFPSQQACSPFGNYAPTGPAPTISRSGFCIQQKPLSTYFKRASPVQGAVRKFQSRFKAAFLDNLAILTVADDCVWGRSRCFGKEEQSMFQRELLASRFSERYSLRFVAIGVELLLSISLRRSIDRDRSALEIFVGRNPVRRLIRSGPPGR